MVKHAIDEFFDMGKYLIIGAFLAAFVQTYVSTKTLVAIGDGDSSSILVMMGLASFCHFVQRQMPLLAHPLELFSPLHPFWPFLFLAL